MLREALDLRDGSADLAGEASKLPDRGDRRSTASE
jgi:hypothetical protein